MALVNLPVGSDAFRAQAISDICADDGIRNELVLHEEEHSRLLGRSHIVIVDETQVDDVRRVISDHFPELIEGTDGLSGDLGGSPPQSSTPLWQRLVLVGGIVAPIIAVIYTLLS